MSNDADLRCSATEPTKAIQELKRRRLIDELQYYETAIQNYEGLYQQEITMLKSQIQSTNWTLKNDFFDNLISSLKSYFDYHTNSLMRTIRYREACLHRKLLRRCYRFSYARNNIINVYPQIIVDAPKISLSHSQLDYLSRTGKNHYRLRI